MDNFFSSSAVIDASVREVEEVEDGVENAEMMGDMSPSLSLSFFVLVVVVVVLLFMLLVLNIGNILQLYIIYFYYIVLCWCGWGVLWRCACA